MVKDDKEGLCKYRRTKKFNPAHVRDQKLAEFEELAKGDMTVQHHECKFIELWRHAEDLVEKEKEKIQRFLKGLKSAIRKDVTSVELHTYPAVVKKALWAEKAHNEIYEKRNLRNKNRPQGSIGNMNASHNSTKFKKQKIGGTFQSRPGSSFCGIGHETN